MRKTSLTVKCYLQARQSRSSLANRQKSRKGQPIRRKQRSVRQRRPEPRKMMSRRIQSVPKFGLQRSVWGSNGSQFTGDGRSRKRACGEGRQRPRTYEKCNALDIKRNSPDQPLDKMTHAAHSAYIKKQKHGEKVSWDYWLAWPSFCHLCGTRRSSDDELFKHLRRDEVDSKGSKKRKGINAELAEDVWE
ncbi:hypothetical protein IWZ01DRAFT_16676 [Phyllosticta capitalensis]